VPETVAGIVDGALIVGSKTRSARPRWRCRRRAGSRSGETVLADAHLERAEALAEAIC